MNTLIKIPQSKAIVTNIGKVSKIQCLKRTYLVNDGAEERVRQRVLDWLINHKKMHKNLIDVEVGHEWISDENHSRVRSDIELFDDNKRSVLVIECKAPGIKLTPCVFDQALKYAFKSGAKSVWITNGEEHKFKTLVSGKWIETDTLEVLDIRAPVPKVLPDFPNHIGSSDIDKYLLKRHENGDPDFTKHTTEYKRIVTALHKLFFHTPLELPYSTDSGFHILQDYGPTDLTIKNASRSIGYSGWYRGFATGTTGRIATLHLGVSLASRNSKSAQICIVTQTNRRVNHVLQLRLEKEHCILDRSKNCWIISHSGRMTRGNGYGVKNKDVRDAVRESGLGHLIYKSNGKKLIFLGQLQFPESSFTWENSKELITNLLLYGLIRYNLRIVLTARNKK